MLHGIHNFASVIVIYKFIIVLLLLRNIFEVILQEICQPTYKRLTFLTINFSYNTPLFTANLLITVNFKPIPLRSLTLTKILDIDAY